jgi:hypothetical protein
MILFDWNKIIKESDRKAKKFFAILHLLTFNSVPKNRKDILYSVYGKDYSGSSFLVHPEKIFYYFSQYSVSEWVEYVKIASMRNYNNYRISKDTSLDLYILDKQIKGNRLLTVKNNKIFFLFEDAKGEN